MFNVKTQVKNIQKKIQYKQYKVWNVFFFMDSTSETINADNVLLLYKC